MFWKDALDYEWYTDDCDANEGDEYDEDVTEDENEIGLAMRTTMRIRIGMLMRMRMHMKGL